MYLVMNFELFFLPLIKLRLAGSFVLKSHLIMLISCIVIWHLMIWERFEAFTVAKVNKIFVVYQLCQLVKNYWHQTLIIGTEMVPETSVIFNQLTWLVWEVDYEWWTGVASEHSPRWTEKTHKYFSHNRPSQAKTEIGYLQTQLTRITTWTNLLTKLDMEKGYWCVTQIACFI
jgi:hypothetical protein